MKAILVIDMPESCIDCKFMKHGICLAYKSERRMNDEEYYSCDEIKPSWCPLKQMPKKLDENDWHRMFGGLFSERIAKGMGWNACLEEIEG